MDQKNEQKAPLRIKNLAELKRCIRPGTELVATSHSKHPTAGPQSQSKALSGKFGISRRLNLSDAEIMRLTGLARNTYYKYKRELRGK